MSFNVSMAYSDFVEPRESFRKKVLIDALNQFLGDREKTEENPTVIAKFSSQI